MSALSQPCSMDSVQPWGNAWLEVWAHNTSFSPETQLTRLCIQKASLALFPVMTQEFGETNVSGTSTGIRALKGPWKGTAETSEVPGAWHPRR